eukprot:7834918-Pyramimonas_sp.AAC.3
MKRRLEAEAAAMHTPTGGRDAAAAGDGGGETDPAVEQSRAIQRLANTVNNRMDEQSRFLAGLQGFKSRPLEIRTGCMRMCYWRTFQPQLPSRCLT